MIVEAARIGEIARGGVKLVRVEDTEIALCNCGGEYYAVSRRCSHQNGPLEMGTTDGTILTCPLHHVQFDVTTGEALNYPIFEYSADPAEEDLRRSRYKELLTQHDAICDIRTYPVEIQADTIIVRID